MNSTTAASEPLLYMRPGFTSVTPYLIVEGAAQFIEFLKSAFAATERRRVSAPSGLIMHAEVTIGNGLIELAEASTDYPKSPAAIHLYVEDADVTFDRAIQAGATSMYPVADQTWGDRQGGVKDLFGNHWYIAKANWTPGPDGIPAVQPFLHLHAAHAMITFAEAAFDAESLGVAKSPEGLVRHATLRIGNATFEVDEAHGEFQPINCCIHIYVPDVDAIHAQALKAGAISLEAPQDKPYGDRSATIKDPWGNSWFVASYLRNETI